MKLPLIAAILSLWIVSVRASTPTLGSIHPRGAQVGTTATLTFNGDRLTDAEEVLLYDEGLTISAIKVEDAKKVTVTVAIAEDCPLGEQRLRLRCRSGITELRTFWVGQFPAAAEVEPNNDFAAPQLIEKNITLHGLTENEDVDYYEVQLTKGERLSVEIEAIRLGLTLFDPYVAILNNKRFEIVARDDSALLVQDTFASIIAPEDGVYVIEIRDSSYSGGGNFHYRAHVGNFPRPTGVYPPGGQVGEALAVTYLDATNGDQTKTIPLPEKTNGSYGVRLEQDGLRSPAPNVLRVSDFPNVLEKEPNNQRKEATASEGTLPLAFNGIISEAGDEDWHRFTGMKDQKLEIRVHARSIRSPLDSVLNLYAPDGKHLAGDDDGAGPDARLVHTLPADGDFTFRVKDHLGKGGPDYVYRVEITPVIPSLTVSIPRFQRNNSQTRQTIPVPRGNRYACLFNASRSEFGGDLVFEVPGLPTGAQFHAEPMAANINVFPVVFEAAPDAPIAGGLLDVLAKHADPEKAIQGDFTQNVELVLGPPNNTVFYGIADPGKLPVSVVEEIPFTINMESPKVPLVRNGTIDLKITATRKEGFTKPITLRMLWNPPGIGSPGTIQIPEGKTEALYRLNANGGAETKTWKIAMLGESNDGNGAIYASTALTPITISPPYVTGKIEMAATEKGATADVVCKLEHHLPFEGKARLELIGLPAKCTSEPLEIEKGVEEIVFSVKTEADSPVGKHKNLFCSMVILHEGTPIPHTVAQGGVLRIDEPPPAPKETPAKAEVADKKPDQPKKRLSRLEQLRLAAKQAREQRKP
jgi:hypothetical protein